MDAKEFDDKFDEALRLASNKYLTSSVFELIKSGNYLNDESISTKDRIRNGKETNEKVLLNILESQPKILKSILKTFFVD